MGLQPAARISRSVAEEYADFGGTPESRLHSSGEDKMHSMQIVEFGKPLEARDRPTPKPQGTEVLLRVEACGVCHSDLHIQEGYFDLGGGNKLELGKLGLKLPHTLGH
jgi:D-arabinose 1-dehydrogenase-like Zn-dependent alcohol dehydrogenase